MAKGPLLHFVSDLHGSSLCFRKFVNATGVYKPTVLVLGGDVAGKAIQSIVKGPNGRWNCTFIGSHYELTEGSELAGLERLIADHGYYPYREQQLAAAYAEMADKLEHPERAVFNLHPPPYATQLDDAPALDDELRVQAVLGQIQYTAVGSTAVRDIEAERQPLVGLHGHIHESSGIRRLGKRKGLILNPGSDYSTGALNGALVSLHKDRADAQLVRG
jgi:Icc-related predicted phosphoesterase